MNKVINSLPQGVFILDEAGKFLLINPAFSDMIGYDQNELVGKKLDLIFQGFSCSSIDKIVKNSITQEALINVHPTIKTKSGLLSSAELVGIKLDRSIGAYLFICSPSDFLNSKPRSEESDALISGYKRLFEHNPIPLFEEDFSEVRKALANLKAQNIDLREYFEENPDLIFEFIQKIIILDANKAATVFHGVKSRADLIGKVTPFVSEVNKSAYIDELIAISEDQKLYKVEKVTVFSREKAFRYIDFYWMVESDHEDSWSKVIVSLIDNTELHNREATLRLRESRLAEASMLAQLGYYELEFPLGKGYWSPEIFRILGMDPSRGSITFAEIRRIIHPDDLPRLSKAFSPVTNPNNHFDLEFRLYASNGAIRFVHAVGERDPGQDQNSQKIRGTLIDITTRKEIEIEQMRSQARLAETARLTSVGKLAAGIAHQLFNPLTTIIAESQMLRQMLPGELSLLENINDIEAAGWKAQRIVQLLSEFAQPPSSARTSIHVNDTIQKALKLVGTQLLIDGISIKKDLADDLPEIPGFDQRLENLWINLFLILPSIVEENCIPTLNIHTNFDEKWITISLRADGCEFPSNLITTDSLTALETPESQSLIGLEISVCKEIIRQANGTFIISIDDIGTTFVISFPRKADDEHFTDINR
jgi:PAS domain S-box-containing protein